MASVDLTKVLIAPVDDLSAVVALEAYAVDENVQRDVEIEQFVAGGTVRYRPLKRPGKAAVVRVIAQELDRGTWLALRDLAGEVVLYRDPTGRRLFGLFAEIDASELIPLGVVEPVGFSVTEVTESEIV